MNLKQQASELRSHKEEIEKKIFDLVKQFQINTGLQVKEIAIAHTPLIGGKSSLYGIKIISEI